MNNNQDRFRKLSPELQAQVKQELGWHHSTEDKILTEADKTEVDAYLEDILNRIENGIKNS